MYYFAQSTISIFKHVIHILFNRFRLLLVLKHHIFGFFTAGQGVGAGHSTGSGAGYGAQGGVAKNGGATGIPHGSLLNPMLFGSGGGGTRGGNGGGHLELDIKGLLVVDGNEKPFICVLTFDTFTYAN